MSTREYETASLLQLKFGRRQIYFAARQPAAPILETRKVRREVVANKSVLFLLLFLVLFVLLLFFCVVVFVIVLEVVQLYANLQRFVLKLFRAYNKKFCYCFCFCFCYCYCFGYERCARPIRTGRVLFQHYVNFIRRDFVVAVVTLLLLLTMTGGKSSELSTV